MAIFKLLGTMCYRLWGEYPLICMEDGYVHLAPGQFGGVTWHPKSTVAVGPDGLVVESHPMQCPVHVWQNGKRISPVRYDPPSASPKPESDHPKCDTKTHAGLPLPLEQEVCGYRIRHHETPPFFSCPERRASATRRCPKQRTNLSITRARCMRLLCAGTTHTRAS